MNDSKTAAAGDTLVYQLETLLQAEGARAPVGVVLYTSFGVVRGKTAPLLAAHSTGEEVDGEGHSRQVIEVSEVSVEHYSSHLPTANFDRLYLRLADVHGFALEDS